MNKNWFSLFSTNFLGVTDNNFLKNLVGFVAVAQLGSADKATAVMLASGLYVLPYIFFSPLAGRLAKTRRKSRIMFLSKLAELPVFVVACVGFFFHSMILVLASVFIIGLISTLFSPSKYGLIRDIGGDKKISFGTGTLEMLTFLGVLIGTFFASVVSDHYGVLLVSVIVIGLSLFEVYTSWKLKLVAETEPIVSKETINPICFLIQSFKWAKSIDNLNVVILGLSTFWMIGSVIQMNLMVHCEKVLHMTDTKTGLIMTIAAVGIGLGSYLTGLFSKGSVELGFTPIGSIGMLGCFLTLYLAEPTGIFFTILVFLTAFFAGVYMVPLSAFVQHSVEGRMQGDMLAYSNFTIFLFILISAGIFGWVVNMSGTTLMWFVMFLIIAVVSGIMLFHIKEMGKRFTMLFKSNKN